MIETFIIWNFVRKEEPVSSGSTKRKLDLYVGDIDVEDFKNTVTLRFKPQNEKKTMVLNRVMMIRKRPPEPL